MTISNYDDVIDSRQIIEQIEELRQEVILAIEDQFDDSIDSQAIYENCLKDEENGVSVWIGDDDSAELISLIALAKEASDYSPDWKYGATLIRDSYFKEYAMGLAEDLGLIGQNEDRWPHTCIDWDQAARELQQDYTTVSFVGVDYWIR